MRSLLYARTLILIIPGPWLKFSPPAVRHLATNAMVYLSILGKALRIWKLFRFVIFISRAAHHSINTELERGQIQKETKCWKKKSQAVHGYASVYVREGGTERVVQCSAYRWQYSNRNGRIRDCHWLDPGWAVRTKSCDGWEICLFIV